MSHIAGNGEILTYSGRYVKPLEFTPEMVDINDIAHALSLQCRYSGHVREFYSVAQHSVLCAQYLVNRGASIEVIKQGLLHDAAEAYLQDMARPLKEDEFFGAAYRDAEFEIEQVIAEVFGVEFPFDPAVKEADIALLALERERLMPENGVWGITDGVSLPTDLNFESWPPHIAKERFLEAFVDLFTADLKEVPMDDPVFEHDSPFEGFKVMSLDDFIAGRFENAVPLEELEGQGEEPPVEDGNWITEALAAAQEYNTREVDADLELMHVQGIPEERHPNSARFHELLQEAGAMHDRKQADYGRGGDPFANVRASEDWGIKGWVGAMVRANDKVRRLQSLSQKGFLRNESAFDSLMDIAVYALIAYVLLEQEQAAA